MLVLFDFKAAFPSVSHDFLKTSLNLLGLPQHALNLIEALYDNNKCKVTFQGKQYEGFDMESGVRQGCPISPLLFAASVDILLRILAKRLPGNSFRAFADDIGAVFSNWDQASPIAETIFKEFAEMSGLELNISKTVCIPLWDENIQTIQQRIKASRNMWSTVKVADKGKYLGFQIGPGSPGKSWDKPLLKYYSRCKQWGDLGLGTLFTANAYNTFICSTLGFVAQLVPVDSQVIRPSKKASTE